MLFRSVFNNKVLIFDAPEGNRELRTKYLKESKGIQADFVCREGLLKYLTVGQKIFSVFFLFVWFFVSLVCLFKKTCRKESLALSYLEFLEIVSLISVIDKNQIERLHFFCPYEKDVNLIIRILFKKGVYVVRHPSPGPLTAHNKNALGSELALSSGYQLEEFEQYKGKSILISKISKWVPESAFSYYRN